VYKNKGGDIMQRCCIYKLKEDKTINEFEEKFSRYVYVEDFAKHPLYKDMELQAIYRYIDIDTLELASQICNCYILPVSIFEEYFEISMDAGEIKEKIYKIESNNKI
jgi:hypothetical protein